MNKHPLTQYREKRSLTLAQFGDLVGATKSAVSKWESGAMPRKPTLNRIREVTGGELTAHDFLVEVSGAA